MPTHPRPEVGNKVGQRDPVKPMQISIHTLKTETFYTACSPELAIISYGRCREEALNGLQDEIRIRERAEGRADNGN